MIFHFSSSEGNKYSEAMESMYCKKNNNKHLSYRQAIFILFASKTSKHLLNKTDCSNSEIPYSDWSTTMI